MIADIRRRTSFNSDEKLFIDANIWYFIYGPKPKGGKDSALRNIYSIALQKMLDGGSHIYIDQLIISEFINTYAKEFYNKKYEMETKKPKFKDYRKSHEFKEVAKLIVTETKKILKNSHPCDSGIEEMDLNSHLAEYEKCVLDFNDIIFGDLCRNKDFILVTNDSDFKGHCASILTANVDLL